MKVLEAATGALLSFSGRFLARFAAVADAEALVLTSALGDGFNRSMKCERRVSLEHACLCDLEQPRLGLDFDARRRRLL